MNKIKHIVSMKGRGKQIPNTYIGILRTLKSGYDF